MLPKTVNELDLHDMFARFGPLKEIHIIRGPDGHSKGCAFVKFVEREAAMMAIHEMNDTLPEVAPSQLFLPACVHSCRLFLLWLWCDVFSFSNVVCLQGSSRPLVIKFADNKKLGREDSGEIGFGSSSGDAEEYWIQQMQQSQQVPPPLSYPGSPPTAHHHHAPPASAYAPQPAHSTSSAASHMMYYPPSGGAPGYYIPADPGSGPASPMGNPHLAMSPPHHHHHAPVVYHLPSASVGGYMEGGSRGHYSNGPAGYGGGGGGGGSRRGGGGGGGNDQRPAEGTQTDHSTIIYTL
jgi:hypothetical protein